MLLTALDPQVAFHPVLILLENRIIFAQRMALPVVRHENAPEIGVAGEFDAEHIEDLALQPIGSEVAVPSAIAVFSRRRSLREKLQRR